MRIKRWDLAIVGMVAVFTAGALTGFDGHWAAAGGDKQPPVAFGPSIRNCRLQFETAGGAHTAGQNSSVSVTVTNHGDSETDFILRITAEKLELQPSPASVRNIAMSRRRLPTSFKRTTVAERTVAVQLQPNEIHKAQLTFNLPAGNYTIYAADVDAPGKKTPIGSLLVSTAVKTKNA